MDNITFAVEPVAACWRELHDAGRRIQETFSEAGRAIGYDPNWDLYALSESRGMFLVVVARASDRKLAGAAMYFISTSPHSKHFLAADADGFFVLPEYRRGGTADHLLAFAEGVLKERGVRAVLHHTRAQMDVSSLFRRHGFEPSTRVFMKRLDQ